MPKPFGDFVVNAGQLVTKDRPSTNQWCETGGPGYNQSQTLSQPMAQATRF